jgi:hypothetical protein
MNKYKFRYGLFVLLAAALPITAVAENDDELFGDDAVINATEPAADPAHGIMFRNGSVKIGGMYDMELTTLTTFGKDISVNDAFNNTLLTPLGDAQFTVDARPSDNLRMFCRTGIHFPYITEKNATTGKTVSVLYDYSLYETENKKLSDSDKAALLENLFYVKELFTDFSLYDHAYFRFGKHTVTWGTGYFFSPAGNVVNLTEIDPEHTDRLVEGPLSLRTQIVFSGTQNCIWLYLLPDISTYRAGATAFAAKGEIVLGGWELGLGGYYKYEYAPRLIATASGSLFNKINTFAECVAAGGTDDDWADDFSFSNKTPVWQATAGGSYYWKLPQITFAAQYYYDGKETDTTTNGSNIAATVSFAKVCTTNITGLLYSNINFDKKTAVTSGMLSYSPLDELTLGAGPYVVWSSFDNSPKISLKVNAKLGGGTF